jgi:hypothetical protein
MKIINTLISFILVAILLVSCHSEEIEPITLPKFSVAFVQNLTNKNVQFAANILDYGSEEIIEYGFVYGKNTPINKENAEYVYLKGKPEKQFSIKATQGMQEGQSYHVSAFIQTKTTTIYSEPYLFTSQGSEGFIFEKINIPDPLYFDDTITVYGKNLSKLFSKYSVYVKQEYAPVVKITEDYFQFLLPKTIRFGGNDSGINTFTFNFEIADKKLSLNETFNFRKPEIKQTSNRTINFNESIVIEGAYLEDIDLYASYSDRNANTYYPLRILEIQKNFIRLSPNANFLVNNPEISLFIRGENINIQNAFTLNPSNFEPSQNITTKVGNIITAKVININPHAVHFNKLLFGHSNSTFQLTYPNNVNSKEIQFTLNENVSRHTEVYFETFGKKSTNALTITFTDPYIPVAQTIQNNYYPGMYGSKAVSSGDKGYIIENGQIYSFHPKTKLFSVASKSSAFYNANVFALTATNDKIYFGSNGQTINLFEFNPATNKISKLSNIPTSFSSPKAVYSTSKYIYYEGGFKQDENYQNIESNERWRYTFSTNSWEKLSSTSLLTELSNSHLFFRYNNKLYALGEDKVSSFKYIAVFNENSESWTKTKQFNNFLNIQSNEIHVIKDKAYLVLENELWYIDLSTFELMKSNVILEPIYFSNSLLYSMSFKVGNQFYVLNTNTNIYEFDPDYF